MGCTQSSSAVDEKEQPLVTDGDKKVATDTDNAEKPRPMIFAIMRNGHEVIRGSMKDIETAVDADDIEEAMKIYGKLEKWMMVHKLMEEGHANSTASPKGMFRVLDSRFDNVATNAGLLDDHATLHELEVAVRNAIHHKDRVAFQVEYARFQKMNLDHLTKEEDIMMPKVAEMIKMGINMKNIMVEEVLALVVDTPEFEHFVRYANEVLERHHDNMPRVQVFDHALWAVSTVEQWGKYDVWIKESVSAEHYKEIMDAIHGVK